ncbi:hypothetical protein [Thermosinus carboxydivorans]|uniref:hypothetical protein n=1 Tax=Thermosinus carboxydivorans TaxID=261685 RepID=UPI000593C50C|nr:hypothetical protein [Thermosinus carboxydivorans]
MASGISLDQFNREMALLPEWKQKLIEACFILENNPEKFYKHPARLLRAIASALHKTGHVEYLNVCRKCGGTGLYDMHTTYRDDRGKPFCFRCNGLGYDIKKLSDKRIEEVRVIVEKYRADNLPATLEKAG